jgi:dTDP-4-dehydrorhamnose reductase
MPEIIMSDLKSVLVTGANGQLGRSIQQLATSHPSFKFHFVGRDQLDLSRLSSIVDFFRKQRFDIVINCAAYTAVDKAEQEAELADMVNHCAVRELAETCKRQHSTLIHISTDYVFDGRHHQPYIESDSPNPQTVYGDSKLKGELAMQAINPTGLIIRTSWVYSEYGNNFVKTMLRLGKEREHLSVVFDQIGSPTYAGDLAVAILAILDQTLPAESTSTPVFHYSNEGACSWYDFAQAIFQLSNCSCNLKPIESRQYPTPAIRPHYSLLNKAKFKSQFNLTIPYWRQSLITCIRALKESQTL